MIVENLRCMLGNAFLCLRFALDSLARRWTELIKSRSRLMPSKYGYIHSQTFNMSKLRTKEALVGMHRSRACS
jgi:hypothetical protein